MSFQRLLIAVPGASELLTDHLGHGEGVICSQILTRLAGRGHRVVAMAPRLEMRVVPPGLELVAVPRRAGLTLLEPFAYNRRVAGLLAAMNPAPDIVHWILPFDPERGFITGIPATSRLVLGPVPYAWPLTRRDGARAVLARLAQALLEPAVRRRNLETLRRASQITVTLPGVTDRLPRWCWDRVRQVPNGVDTSRFTPARSAPPGPYTILYLASLEPKKGLDHLLAAMPAVLQNLPQARLLVAGGPASAVPHYRELAAGLGVETAVEFLGPVSREQAPDLFRRASVHCLPSIAEPFGMSILEAMASGLPVVATGAGGIPEYVHEGEEGLLVPPADPGALAAALVRLAREPGLAAAMGRSNRVRAVQSYDWERVVDRIEDAYRESLQERIPG